MLQLEVDQVLHHRGIPTKLTIRLEHLGDMLIAVLSGDQGVYLVLIQLTPPHSVHEVQTPVVSKVRIVLGTSRY